MGCCNSTMPKGKAVLLKEREQKTDFRDVYVIGVRLGEGAFGTVFECRKKNSSDTTTYAVKMMEHQTSWWGRFSSSQEAQWQMFAHEYEMLKKMQHPALVKMQAVFIDDYFVYFVMDKYECCLINAVLPLLKGNSKEMCSTVIGEIVAQMLDSLVYMHSQLIVHRDVKADNYLVDGTRFKQTHFKVVLTDFSTARHLEEGVFLSDLAGTKEYWAPELIMRSYAHKVDVWAAGTIMWCMLTLKFPFSTVQERFTRHLKKTSNMSQDHFNLLQGMLHKDPVHRLSAKSARENSWVTQQSEAHHFSISGGKREVSKPFIVTALDVSDFEVEAGDGPQFIQTRRVSDSHVEDSGHQQTRIIEKMRLAEEKFNQGQRLAIAIEDKLDQIHLETDTPRGQSEKKFSITGKQRVGETKIYEWWSEERCRAKKVPDTDTECIASTAVSTDPDNTACMCAGDIVVGELASIDYLGNLYTNYNMDVSKLGVGQAKRLTDLYHELQMHESCLLIRDSRLIRIVDLVVLRLRSCDGKYLVEVEQKFVDGRVRNVRRLPAVMCRAKGKGVDSALIEINRVLESELQVSKEVINMDGLNDAEEVNIDMTYSQSYPGLETIYRRYIFTAAVGMDAAPAVLAKMGQPLGNDFRTSLADGTVICWQWWDEKRCREMNIPIDPQQRDLEDFEGFQHAPGGKWTEASLTEFLKKHKVSTELFGMHEARTIAQLASEVNSGETRLYEKPDCPGELRRYLEILIVRIKNSFGAYFIETAHSFGRSLKRQRNLLPATKLRPFEDKIWSVRRLLSELDIPFANSKTCFGPRRTELATSPSYPGIVTVYLKQVVEVQLENIEVEALETDLSKSNKWYQHDIEKPVGQGQ